MKHKQTTRGEVRQALIYYVMDLMNGKLSEKNSIATMQLKILPQLLEVLATWSPTLDDC